ncbi:hypothetical protein PIB30_021840 [Stylosanthes scabra]|uniref:Uncharacterized protein n=1 Tax=Stylosanthes scabra TaxID=79078 RepID=A0ABU6Y770_9FABA|nr:hypothetical protein [Stylosanthes scabra]
MDSENEVFAKCFESILIWGKSIRFRTESKRAKNRLEVRAEPIRFWAVAKTKFLNRFAILASRLELLDFEDFKNLHLRRVDSNREPRSRGACGANDSAYGNSGPSGVVSVVGSLFPRGAKTNVAAHGSGRGASCQRPGYQPRF